jgi:hypothetical protein
MLKTASPSCSNGKDMPLEPEELSLFLLDKHFKSVTHIGRPLKTGSGSGFSGMNKNAQLARVWHAIC